MPTGASHSIRADERPVLDESRDLPNEEATGWQGVPRCD